MADTGVKYPGTVATQAVSPEDDKNWTNPNNIKADDDSYAQSGGTGAGTVYSYRLKATNFGFSLPVGAIIDGIKVEIQRYESNSSLNAYDYRVQLLDADGNLVGDNKANANEWATSWETITYGGATDKWNASPTKAMVEDADFGVVLSFRGSVTLPGSRYGRIDFIRKTIYYTVGAVETKIANSFPMEYLASPAKAEELRSKVSGASITIVTNDFPPILQKAGKAKELVSKWN